MTLGSLVASDSLAAHLSAAVAQAAALLPGSAALVAGETTADPAAVALPPDAASGVLARLSGQVTGVVLAVVSADLVEALAHSPLGPLDVAAAVQPALDAAAAALGQVTAEAGQTLPVDVALDALRQHSLVHAVALLREGAVAATVALAVTVPPPAAARPTVRTAGLELLRDVEMEVTVELGRTRMTVRELLSLTPGAVVELDRAAGSPVDLLVNGTLIARGEVVVVDEDFGVRVTQIVTAEHGDA